MTRRRLHRWARAAVAPFLGGLLFGVVVSLLNGSSFFLLAAASL
jgi:hypothetical protein